MSKRGNDLSQLTKEEYEVAMAKGSSSSVGNGFKRASNDVLGSRRILRTGGKWKKANAAVDSSSASSLGGAGAAPVNPFSNFTFTKASSSTSLTAPSITAKAHSTSSSKPAFAMHTHSAGKSNTSTTNKTLSLSESLLYINPKISAAPATQASSDQNGEDSQLIQGFKKFIADQDIRTDWSLGMERYIDTYNDLNRSKASSSTSGATTSNATAATTSSPALGNLASTTSSAASTASSKPLLPPATGAPAPGLFSFGSTSAPSSAAVSKPTFSFGNTASSSAPAPASSSSGFGFEFGGKAASTGSTNSSSTPTAAATPSGKENKNDSANTEDGKIELQSADDDWNQLYTTKVKVYHHLDKTVGPKHFATGELKLQELKSDTKVSRMVMRDIAGKVTLNVAISKSMTFGKTESKTKKGLTVARIQFMGIREKDPELLTMVCKKEVLDEFHGRLAKMSS